MVMCFQIHSRCNIKTFYNKTFLPTNLKKFTCFFMYSTISKMLTLFFFANPKKLGQFVLRINKKSTVRL